MPVFSVECYHDPAEHHHLWRPAEAKQVLGLVEALEELDDVQNVYANFDIPEEVMAAL